jgi:hypothetical protein
MAFVAAPGAALVQIGELVKVVFVDKKEYLFSVTDIDHGRRVIRGIYEVDGSESPPLDGQCRSPRRNPVRRRGSRLGGMPYQDHTATVTIHVRPLAPVVVTVFRNRFGGSGGTRSVARPTPMHSTSAAHRTTTAPTAFVVLAPAVPRRGTCSSRILRPLRGCLNRECIRIRRGAAVTRLGGVDPARCNDGAPSRASRPRRVRVANRRGRVGSRGRQLPPRPRDKGR